jgi:hypothetical protein
MLQFSHVKPATVAARQIEVQVVWPRQGVLPDFSSQNSFVKASFYLCLSPCCYAAVSAVTLQK